MTASRQWQRLTASIAFITIGFAVVWIAVVSITWRSILAGILRRSPPGPAAEFWHVWLPLSAAIFQAGLSGPLAASVIERSLRRIRWLFDAYGIGMASYLAYLFIPDRSPASIVSVAVVAATAFVVARRRSSWIPWLAGAWATAAILGMTPGVSTDEPVTSAGWILLMIACVLLARYVTTSRERLTVH